MHILRTKTGSRPLFSQPRLRFGTQSLIGDILFMASKSTKRIVNESIEDANEQQGLGPASAGQSGDLQGLSPVPDANAESVEELVEEGQALEADAVAGVEDAPDADASEVRVRQRPEDDLREEYLDRD
jgi:hypothetical protein